jgi:hypothetical protein
LFRILRYRKSSLSFFLGGAFTGRVDPVLDKSHSLIQEYSLNLSGEMPK